MRKRLKKKLTKKARDAEWGKTFIFPLMYESKGVSRGEALKKYPPRIKGVKPEISMELFKQIANWGREK